MSQSMVIGIAREAIFTVLFTAGPVMIAALVVGLIISVLQATTQVQEQTLTFVPKILTVIFVVLIMLPFMMSKLSDFSLEMFNNISNVLR